MTPAQLLRYGEREPLDFSVDPDQSISLTPPPPVSPVRRREPQLPPRRSSRVGRGTPGSRFSDYGKYIFFCNTLRRCYNLIKLFFSWTALVRQ